MSTNAKRRARLMQARLEVMQETPRASLCVFSCLAWLGAVVLMDGIDS